MMIAAKLRGTGGTLATGLAILAGAATSSAEESDNATFEFYGQLNFAYQAFDDGEVVTDNIVDITNSNSRVGFYLKDGLPVHFHFESGLGFRPSSSTSQVNTPDFLDWDITFLRIVELVWDSEFGKVGFGQGKMPTDGAAEADLGGTVVVAKSTIPEADGSYIFRTESGDLSDITIKDGFNNLDGARRFRLRYDSPEFSGLSLAAAYGREILESGDDNDYYGIALNYGNDFGSAEVKGTVGVSFVDDDEAGETTSETVGSIAVLQKTSGLNLSIAGGRRNDEGGQYVYLKPGWNIDFWSGGTTKFVGEYFIGNDYDTDGSESEMWGLGIIQDIDDYGLEVYAGYRAFSYDDDAGVGYQDANAIQIGARARF